MYICDTVLVQPVLPRPQRRHTDHVRSAVLESPGILAEVERMDGPNAGPAAAHLLDYYMLPNTEAADAHAPHERFVAGECDDVDVHLLHVDRNDAGGLSGIHDERDAALATDSSDLPDRLHRANHVRPVVDDHQLGVRPHRPGDIVRVDEPCAVERDKRRFRSVIPDHVVDW